MPWFYVDDGFATSKPVMNIPKALRAAAIGVWTLSGTWSAKEMRDGYVPMEIVKANGGTPRIVATLIKDAELWEAATDGKTDGILFKNWSKWQPKRDEILAKRKAESDRKQKWREAKRGQANVPASDDEEMSTRDEYRDEDQDSKSMSTRDTRSYPDPTRPLVESLGAELTQARGQPGTPPPKFCPRHPNDTDRKCGACQQYRQRYEAWEADRKNITTAERQRAAAALKACTLCDDAGWELDQWGDPLEPARRCDHRRPPRLAAVP